MISSFIYPLPIIYVAKVLRADCQHTEDPPAGDICLGT